MAKFESGMLGGTSGALTQATADTLYLPLAGGTLTGTVIGTTGSFVTGSFTNGSITTLRATSGSFTNGTITTLVGTTGSFTNGTITTLIGTNSSFTNGTITTLKGTEGTLTTRSYAALGSFTTAFDGGAAPTVGNQLTNKTYVDGLSATIGSLVTYGSFAAAGTFGNSTNNVYLPILLTGSVTFTAKARPYLFVGGYDFNLSSAGYSIVTFNIDGTTQGALSYAYNSSAGYTQLFVAKVINLPAGSTTISMDEQHNAGTLTISAANAQVMFRIIELGN